MKSLEWPEIILLKSLEIIKVAKKLNDEINRKKFTVKFSEAQRKALEDKGLSLSEGCNLALERFLGIEYIDADTLEKQKYRTELELIHRKLDRLDRAPRK